MSSCGPILSHAFARDHGNEDPSEPIRPGRAATVTHIRKAPEAPMIGLVLPSALPLPPPVQRRIDAAARELLQPTGGPSVDFARPPGEEALVAPDSVSWRIFKNPVSLFIGGGAAGIPELAGTPARAGAGGASSFPHHPGGRPRPPRPAAPGTPCCARST